MTITNDDIESALSRLQSTKSASDEAKAAYDAVRHRVFEDMEGDGAERWSSKEGHGTATIIAPMETALDEAGLLAELTPKQAAAITTTSVDVKKLEAAVELGTIEAEVVSKYVSERPKKRYLRYGR